MKINIPQSINLTQENKNNQASISNKVYKERQLRTI